MEQNKSKQVNCEGSLIELVSEDGTWLKSHGECILCGAVKAIELLQLPKGAEKASYPIVYEGLECKNCLDNNSPIF